LESYGGSLRSQNQVVYEANGERNELLLREPSGLQVNGCLGDDFRKDELSSGLVRAATHDRSSGQCLSSHSESVAEPAMIEVMHSSKHEIHFRVEHGLIVPGGDLENSGSGKIDSHAF